MGDQGDARVQIAALPLPKSMEELCEFVLTRQVSEEVIREAFRQVETRILEDTRSIAAERNKLIEAISAKHGATREQLERQLANRDQTISALASYIERLDEQRREEKRGREEAEEQGRFDQSGITLLYHRKAATKYAVDTLSGRRGESFSFMLVDFHRFKFYNDASPDKHSIGDLVLSHGSEIMTHHVRDAYLCRWGGDELAAILMNVSASVAGSVAMRYMDALQDYPCWPGIHHFLELYQPRADVGVVHYVMGKHEDRLAYGPAKLLVDLVKIADNNMYLCKEDRNRGHERPTAYVTSVTLDRGQLVKIDG